MLARIGRAYFMRRRLERSENDVLGEKAGMADSFDIAVIGGGLVGAATALGAARQGWSVVLIDAGADHSTVENDKPPTDIEDFDLRVSALSPASVRLLSALGAWQVLPASRLCQYQSMVVWDGEGTGHIEFNALEMQAPELGTLVENRCIVRALMSQLKDTHAHILAGQPVTGWAPSDMGQDSILTLGNDERLSANLVIAADGARSWLRQRAGLPTLEWDYNQRAIVCTVETEKPHNDTAWQRFSEYGPLAFLPLADAQGNGRFCSIVWSQDTDEAERLLGLDDDRFKAELESALESKLGAIVSVTRRVSFPLRQISAKSYTRPGLAVIGDAAHAIHPLAGQGANLGFADVDALLQELERARGRRLRACDQEVLGRYERRRKADNLTMMAAMEGFKRLFGTAAPGWVLLRNEGLRFMNRQSALKHQLAKQAMGL